MCLAIPGRITTAVQNGGKRTGTVEFGGIRRETHLDFVPDANVGDYVLVHVGVAISRIDEEEAHKTLEILRQMGELETEETR